MLLSDVLLSPKGRLSIAGFWGVVIGTVFTTFVIGFLLNRLPYLIRQSHMVIDPQLLLGLDFIAKPQNIALIVVAPLLWVSFATFLKRLHDRNRSAWWLLLLCVPIIGWLWLATEVGFLVGTRGHNRFGPSPVWLQADRLMAAADADEDMA